MLVNDAVLADGRLASLMLEEGIACTARSFRVPGLDQRLDYLVRVPIDHGFTRKTSPTRTPRTPTTLRRGLRRVTAQRPRDWQLVFDALHQGEVFAAFGDVGLLEARIEVQFIDPRIKTRRSAATPASFA